MPSYSNKSRVQAEANLLQRYASSLSLTTSHISNNKPSELCYKLRFWQTLNNMEARKRCTGFPRVNYLCSDLLIPFLFLVPDFDNLGEFAWDSESLA